MPDEPRVFPVGRLDRDTEGLLLLTNDGELTHRLTHPSFGVDKEYLAHVEGHPTRAELRRLREGIELDDGLTAPAQVAQVSEGLLRIMIHEGRNRQVRRMCEAIGHPVRRLVRVRIGPLTDRRLQPGDWRALTVDEVRALERAAVAPDPAPGPRGDPSSGRPRRAPPGPAGNIPAMPSAVRALRGATTVDVDSTEQVRERTAALLARMLEANDIHHDDLISVLFTATDDIHSMFPALAAREHGLGRRAAHLRPRARHRRGHPPVHPYPAAHDHRSGPRRAAPHLPRGRRRPPRQAAQLR